MHTPRRWTRRVLEACLNEEDLQMTAEIMLVPRCLVSEAAPLRRNLPTESMPSARILALDTSTRDLTFATHWILLVAMWNAKLLTSANDYRYLLCSNLSSTTALTIVTTWRFSWGQVIHCSREPILVSWGIVTWSLQTWGLILLAAPFCDLRSDLHMGQDVQK